MENCELKIAPVLIRYPYRYRNRVNSTPRIETMRVMRRKSPVESEPENRFSFGGQVAIAKKWASFRELFANGISLDKALLLAEILPGKQPNFATYVAKFSEERKRIIGFDQLLEGIAHRVGFSWNRICRGGSFCWVERVGTACHK